jgi:hypothetical protein
MSADPPEDPSLSKNDLDLLLNLIVTNNNADPNATSNQKEEFPKEYDYSQPAKSWWRYFSKQIETNTAVCYTCGATFNRGPKQSTTSLSHHLKMYHQAQFIFIQQAKDEDNRRNGKQSRPTKVPAKKVEPSEEVSQSKHTSDNKDPIKIISKGKKSAFNLSLIKAVRQRPQIFDPQQRPKTEEEQVRIWRAVADEIGSGITRKSIKTFSIKWMDDLQRKLRRSVGYKSETDTGKS